MSYLLHNTVLCESEEFSQKIADNEFSRLILKLLMKSVDAQKITKENSCARCNQKVEFCVTESKEFGKIGLMPSFCTKCRNDDVIKHEEEKKEMKWNNDKERCCAYQNQYVKHLGECSFFRDISEDFGYQKVFIEKIKDLLENKINIGAIIFGNTGTGKTYLAKILNNELCNQYRNTCFIKAVDLAMALRQITLSRHVDYKTTLKQFQAIEILIIDDYGAQKNTEWVKECIFTILDYRYENRKTTIMTTNCDFEELKAIEPRLYSRLNDRDWVKKIHFNAKDYRIQQASLI